MPNGTANLATGKVAVVAGHGRGVEGRGDHWEVTNQNDYNWWYQLLFLSPQLFG